MSSGHSDSPGSIRIGAGDTQPRSFIRMKAHTDPTATADRLIDVQAERDRLREALEQIRDMHYDERLRDAHKVAREALDA